MKKHRRFTEDVRRLPKNHAWSARPGFKVVVANRGAARFDIPREWVGGPAEGSDLCLHDRTPPDDDCRLEFSLLPVPPIPDPGPALDTLLDQATRDNGDDEVVSRSTSPIERRDGLELVWTEVCYRDADTQRLALSRTCLARGRGVHAVLTMALWADDTARFDPAWHELLRSLDLGRHLDISGRDSRRN
ncbi:MAG: hypothetical protein ACRD0K_15075 [Egibacteraceae bacterium]